MRQKFISLMLTAAMLFGLMPTTFAEGITVSGNESEESRTITVEEAAE